MFYGINSGNYVFMNKFSIKTFEKILKNLRLQRFLFRNESSNKKKYSKYLG